MAKITDQQKAAIKTLTRRANRRLERAPSGQRSALEYYVKKMTGGSKFSAATKGLSFEEAAMKLKTLEQFLGARSTTRKGWDEIKKKNVQKANETLTDQGYDLTDEELADILEQIDTSNKAEYYRAVNLVQAAKDEAEEEGELWSGSSKQIAEAIGQKATAQEALRSALEARRNKVRFNLSLSRGKNPRKKR